MNLLLNAAQATPPGGTITVLAEKVKFAEMIELRVRDTGCGIPADILPHVFEPFFTTKRGKGTGLGLSITQNYVRSHGGDIQVESVPDSGTTVRVTLPIQQAGKPVPHRRGGHRLAMAYSILHCRRRSADPAHHRPRPGRRRLRGVSCQQRRGSAEDASPRRSLTWLCSMLCCPASTASKCCGRRRSFLRRRSWS